MPSIRSYFKRQSYALDELDLKLRPYIKFNNGMFIEAGANNGMSQSNTLYFEKYMGWRGVLIEAIPALAEKCRQNRPKCIVENCALIAADFPEEYVEMNYCNLMSLVKGSLNSDEDEQKHLQSGRRCLADGDDTYSVIVPARTLSDVLDKHHIQHIDLFSLDVEGCEAQVLQGIDFDRHWIEYMLIEVHGRDEVEAVIGHLYKPVSILNIEESYSDILYRRR